METALTIVQTLGFPVAACVFLALFIKYIFDTFVKKIDEIEKEHKEETDKLSEAVTNNTLVMQTLLNKLTEE